MQGKYLWLRANVCNVLAQTLDSVVFFLVAFWGVAPLASVSDIILTGLVIKIVYMMLASLFLYLNTFEESAGANGSVMITLK